jgi:hypothetical protein
MPVFAEGSTTNIPAHNEEAMPCVAATADILSDPEVCWVSLLSSAGCTTLMVDCASGFVDCALGRDDLGIAIAFDSRTHRRMHDQIGFISRAVSRQFAPGRLQLPLAKLYCTVQYIKKTLGGNRQTAHRPKGSDEGRRIKCCCERRIQAVDRFLNI